MKNTEFAEIIQQGDKTFIELSPFVAEVLRQQKKIVTSGGELIGLEEAYADLEQLNYGLLYSSFIRSTMREKHKMPKFNKGSKKRSMCNRQEWKEFIKKVKTT